MNPSRFLREATAVSLSRTSITRINVRDDPPVDYSHDKRKSETPKDEDNERDAGMLNVSQDVIPTVDSQPQTEPSPAMHHEKTPEKTSPIMDHIEFAARRNLEHILGVCAIPVSVHVSEETAKGVIWQKLCDVEPIALSCGDLSGHRICTRSSFFAFQFLAEVAKRLRLGRLPCPGTDDTHVQALLSRIRDVCLGHLKWLYAAEKTDEDVAFRPRYWVSGEAVTISDSDKALASHEHVRNTALQILKAMVFANSFNDDEDGDSSLVGEMISHWGQGWVRWLERSDRRESLTWYHKEDEGLKIFRLDDHVWIWMALKAMEDKRFGVWATLHDRAQRKDRSSSTGSEESHADEVLRRSRKFASRTVQREILRKFTMKHEMLRKEMVALTRSPRESRFLFHARDTALFYGQDMGFFPRDELFQEVWKNTIDVQRLHENNQEARWDNALRYALSLMLGIRGHQINNRKPGDMVRNSIEILLRSSSENGLFPGKLDIMTKGPLEDVFHVEDDADSYYDAGFEIPYIFLIHAKAIGAIIDNTTEPALETALGDVHLRHHPTSQNPKSTEALPAHHDSNSQGQVHQREEDEELRRLLSKLSDILSAQPYIPNSASASDRIGTRELAVDGRHALKKCIPLSNTIDSHSIFEIEDEWLFNYPDFFGSKEDKNISIDTALDSLKELEVTWLTSINVAEMRENYSSHNNEDSVAENQSEASSDHGSSVVSESLISLGAPGDSRLSVMDIPSRKRLQGKGLRGPTDEFDMHIGSFEFMWETISRPRTAAKAKKRIVYWIRRGTDPGLEAALLCYAASKGDERAYMLEFFERHFQHQNFMFDHCNLAYNTWETEVHLSFFVLGDASGLLSGDTAHTVEGFPGVQGKHISRGSVGFRFQGDAFDRYWTFHFFSNLDLETLEATKDYYGRAMTTSEILLFQRKDLELRFFSDMLRLVENNTEHILAEVKSNLGIKSSAFSWSIPSMDRYSSWSTLWEGFAPLVQALADDLASTQDIISQWDAREGSRGQERPRWTRNDERKYRDAITRSQRVLNWRKRGIQKLLDDVKSLQELCTTRLANAREELSFRRNQNIASFTYVTIVFLPLGFAASVFSMNGYPAAGWVASMVVIAVVTLAITVIALANAKLLLAVAEQFSKDALRLTGDVFQSSLIGQHKRQQDERAQASPLLFYNVLDILTFLGRLTRKTFYALVIPSDANGAATDRKMVTWLIEPPSSLRPVRKYMSRDEKSEKPTPQADTPVAADRSDPDLLGEV
ncbi:hypothetical protein INS49_010637 [Diaporthe citri]|uniref:uncharacterized protein n=1 Tax=Diaporthe citri TaxID=83186 RepID=UPI001C7F52EA|nr:uncharacterized protein INS49_010637 [Diaporthe citri]KAG6362407.1 hypothetical protein INS49_010637 [Diaporthe citri]